MCCYTHQNFATFWQREISTSQLKFFAKNFQRLCTFVPLYHNYCTFSLPSLFKTLLARPASTENFPILIASLFPEQLRKKALFCLTSQTFLRFAARGVCESVIVVGEYIIFQVQDHRACSDTNGEAGLTLVLVSSHILGSFGFLGGLTMTMMMLMMFGRQLVRARWDEAARCFRLCRSKTTTERKWVMHDMELHAAAEKKGKSSVAARTRWNKTELHLTTTPTCTSSKKALARVQPNMRQFMLNFSSIFPPLVAMTMKQERGENV